MREDLILLPNDLFQLNLILTGILDTGLSEIVLLINKSGRLITHQAENSSFDAISIAALISGSFASSSSIANLIGEPEFDSLYQAGKDMHIYLAQIDDNNLLTVIFSKRSSLQRVKEVIENYRELLIPILQKLYSHITSDPF